jgi:fatty acyl-CoA reductase
MEDNAAFSVKNFYEGKNVLVTGCTGFLGKVILEKIFQSCKNVNKIYILVREKRNKPPRQRVAAIFESYNFSIVKKQIPNFMEFA